MAKKSRPDVNISKTIDRKIRQMERTGSRKNSAFVVGSVIGAVGGAALALWKTPMSGKQLRTKLSAALTPGDAASGVLTGGNKALSLVESTLAPIVGVKLGQTANGSTGASRAEAVAAPTTDAAPTALKPGSGIEMDPAAASKWNMGYDEPATASKTAAPATTTEAPAADAAPTSEAPSFVDAVESAGIAPATEAPAAETFAAPATTTEAPAADAAPTSEAPSFVDAVESTGIAPASSDNAPIFSDQAGEEVQPMEPVANEQATREDGPETPLPATPAMTTPAAPVVTTDAPAPAENLDVDRAVEDYVAEGGEQPVPSTESAQPADATPTNPAPADSIRANAHADGRWSFGYSDTESDRSTVDTAPIAPAAAPAATDAPLFQGLEGEEIQPMEPVRRDAYTEDLIASPEAAVPAAPGVTTPAAPFIATGDINPSDTVEIDERVAAYASHGGHEPVPTLDSVQPEDLSPESEPTIVDDGRLALKRGAEQFGSWSFGYGDDAPTASAAPSTESEPETRTAEPGSADTLVDAPAATVETPAVAPPTTPSDAPAETVSAPAEGGFSATEIAFHQQAARFASWSSAFGHEPVAPEGEVAEPARQPDVASTASSMATAQQPDAAELTTPVAPAEEHLGPATFHPFPTLGGNE